MRKLLIVFIFGILFASNCDNKLFTFENSLNPQNRVSVREFLNLLAVNECGINVVYSEEKIDDILNKKMPFVKFKNYTLKEILDFLLTKKLNLFYTLDKNELQIKYLITKTYKFNFLSNLRNGTSTLDVGDNKVTNEYQFSIWDKIANDINETLKNNADVITKRVAIKQKDGTVVEKDLKEYYPLKTPIVNKEAGIITVTGNAKQIRAIDKYIEDVKKSLTREVLIDVKIYTVELSKSHKNGIDWSQLSLTLPNSSVPIRAKYIGGSQSIFNSATFDSGAFLNFLAQNGNVNSISNPKIVTLNNQKSLISVGDTIYYKYVSKVTPDQNGNVVSEYEIGSQFVGIILDIVPQISANGEIILSIAPKISNFRDINQLNEIDRGMPPDIRENKMLSVIRVKDGSTIVLGGLITKDKSFVVNGVPILKEIPLIKYLFSSKEEISNKKELVFVITPHIIKLDTKKSLRDLGFGKF